MTAPLTGVAALIVHNNKILIGERVDQHDSCWQLPGGLIDLGETPLQAITREAKEETNLDVSHAQLIAVTNNVFCASKHTISLIFKAKCQNPTKLLLTETNKCASWYWESWESLPTPLFLPFQLLVDTGYHPLNNNEPKNLKNKSNNCFIF